MLSDFQNFENSEKNAKEKMLPSKSLRKFPNFQKKLNYLEELCKVYMSTELHVNTSGNDRFRIFKDKNFSICCLDVLYFFRILKFCLI